MIQPNEQLKQLTLEIPVSDITSRAKLETDQAVLTDDKPVFNIYVNFIPYWN